MKKLKKKIQSTCRYIGENGKCCECGLCNDVADIYEALKKIHRITGTIEGKGTKQASEIWGIINPIVAKAEGK